MLHLMMHLKKALIQGDNVENSLMIQHHFRERNEAEK